MKINVACFLYDLMYILKVAAYDLLLEKKRRNAFPVLHDLKTIVFSVLSRSVKYILVFFSCICIIIVPDL